MGPIIWGLKSATKSQSDYCYFQRLLICLLILLSSAHCFLGSLFFYPNEAQIHFDAAPILQHCLCMESNE